MENSESISLSSALFDIDDLLDDDNDQSDYNLGLEEEENLLADNDAELVSFQISNTSRTTQGSSTSFERAIHEYGDNNYTDNSSELVSPNTLKITDQNKSITQQWEDYSCKAAEQKQESYYNILDNSTSELVKCESSLIHAEYSDGQLISTSTEVATNCKMTTVNQQINTMEQGIDIQNIITATNSELITVKHGVSTVESDSDIQHTATTPEILTVELEDSVIKREPEMPLNSKSVTVKSENNQSERYGHGNKIFETNVHKPPNWNPNVMQRQKMSWRNPNYRAISQPYPQGKNDIPIPTTNVHTWHNVAMPKPRGPTYSVRPQIDTHQPVHSVPQRFGSLPTVRVTVPVKNVHQPHRQSFVNVLPNFPAESQKSHASGEFLPKINQAPFNIDLQRTPNIASLSNVFIKPQNEEISPQLNLIPQLMGPQNLNTFQPRCQYPVLSNSQGNYPRFLPPSTSHRLLAPRFPKPLPPLVGIGTNVPMSSHPYMGNLSAQAGIVRPVHTIPSNVSIPSLIFLENSQITTPAIEKRPERQVLSRDVTSSYKTDKLTRASHDFLSDAPPGVTFCDDTVYQSVDLKQSPKTAKPIPGDEISTEPHVPVKVHINPHFKGSLSEGNMDDAALTFIMEQRKALAKSALLAGQKRNPRYMDEVRDTPQRLYNTDEDELLRKQEEFINANRAGLRKRMRTSPPRSVGRIYSISPPPRRRREFSPESFSSNRSVKGRREPYTRPIRTHPTDADIVDMEYNIRLKEQETKRKLIINMKEVRRRRNAEKLQKIQDERAQTEQRSDQNQSSTRLTAANNKQLLNRVSSLPKTSLVPSMKITSTSSSKSEIDPSIRKNYSKDSSTADKIVEKIADIPSTGLENLVSDPGHTISQEFSTENLFDPSLSESKEFPTSILTSDSTSHDLSTDDVTDTNTVSNTDASTISKGPKPLSEDQLLDEDDAIVLDVTDISFLENFSDDDMDTGRFKTETGKTPIDLRSKLAPKPQRPGKAATSISSIKPERTKITFEKPVQQSNTLYKWGAKKRGTTPPTLSLSTKAKIKFPTPASTTIPILDKGPAESLASTESLKNTNPPVSKRRVVIQTKQSNQSPQIGQKNITTTSSSQATAIEDTILDDYKPEVEIESYDDDSDFDEDAKGKTLSEKEYCTALVYNLPHGMTTARLQNLAGPGVQSVELQKEHRTANLCFKTMEAAQAFVKKFNNRMVAASLLKVIITQKQ